MIAAERQASIAGDLPLLEALWRPNGRVIDAKATTDPGDDYVWTGREALLDRYRLAVFPSPPPPLTELDGLQISASEHDAVVDNGQDRWLFVRDEGRWWMLELTYSRPLN